MTLASDCPFCHVAERHGDRLIETMAGFNVILSSPRRLKGHVLITPMRHIERPWELTSIEREELWGIIYRYQELLSKLFGYGCDLRQQYRPHFEEDNYYKVDHVHYHLLPRVPGDALETEVLPHERRIMIDLPDDERDEMLGLLSNS